MSPIPNHCIECDTPTMDTLCDKCKEKDMNDKICKGCGEVHPICYCDMAPEEDEMSNCCSAPFTYPGFPDSDICSKCKEHADIWEEDDE